MVVNSIFSRNFVLLSELLLENIGVDVAELSGAVWYFDYLQGETDGCGSYGCSGEGPTSEDVHKELVVDWKICLK